jgi:hypothetical protein
MRVSLALLVSLGSFLVPIPHVFAQDAMQSSESTENKRSIVGSYPDTADGLHEFLQSVVAAIKRADSQGISRLNSSLNRSLTIPEPKKWFAKTFRPDAGRDIANAYRSNYPDLVRELERYDLNQLWEIRVTRIEFADEQTAKASGIRFFIGMKNPIPVYTAYLTDPKNQSVILIHALFVYVQGAFRVIDAGFGKIDEGRRPLCGIQPGLQHLLLHSFRVDGQTMQAKLIQPTPPIRFPNVNASGISGTVILFVVIACDGSVLATDYISGPPELFKVASDAVKKWHYKKTWMNGALAEVTTTVTVDLAPGG